MVTDQERGGVMSDSREFRVVRDTNAEDAEKYRLAQANRIIRFCKENGLDLETLKSLEHGDDVLAPIHDDRGQVIPEQRDFDATS